jgi:hypothetical protein
VGLPALAQALEKLFTAPIEWLTPSVVEQLAAISKNED